MSTDEWSFFVKTYFNFDVSNFIHSSDDRSPNHGRKYMGRKIGARIAAFDELQQLQNW